MIQVRKMSEKSKLELSRWDYATYLGYAGYASGSVIIPMVLVAISGELGLDLASGGALHFIRSGVMIFSMLLSGWAAGNFGKKRTLGSAMLLIAAGLLMCSMASGYLLLAMAIILIGLGNGFFESLATGFTQDLHADTAPARYINITHSFWPLGILLTVMGAGVFLEYGGQWRVLVMITAFLLLVPGVLFLYHSGGRNTGSTRKFDFRTATAPLKNPRFLIFLTALFLAGGSEHCFTFWLPSLIELELAGNGILCGTGVALFAAGMFAGRLASGIFNRIKPAVMISSCAVFCAAVSLAIPQITSKYTLMCILPLLGIATGPLWPNLQYFCSSTLKEYDPTTLYILMPLFGIPGCGFFTWLLGLIGGYTGLRNGFYIVFLCNLLIAVLVLISEMISKLIDRKENNINMDIK